MISQESQWMWSARALGLEGVVRSLKIRATRLERGLPANE
jgi:hypothetical protein